MLVTGGTHDQAAEVRTGIAARGGGTAINFTAAVTAVTDVAPSRCRSTETASRASASNSPLVEEQHTKTVVAAALAGGATFGDVGAVTLAVDGDLLTAATATLDAATTERTMLLADIYRRQGAWRLRAIGQGYDDGLAELLTRYGVDIGED